MKRFLLLATFAASACTQTSIQLPPDSATAIDGDTFIAYNTRYRLAEIDAPELPGHCKGYRKLHNECAPGDPFAATKALQHLLDQPGLVCRRLGQDYYNRRLVTCSTYSTPDIGAALINSGHATDYSYKGK